MTLSVSQITAPVRSEVRPEGADCEVLLHQTGEAQKFQPVTGSAGISDEQRERAVHSAEVLALTFWAEYEAHQALWERDSCFTHKGAADRALFNCQEAYRLRGLLIQGRKQ